MDPSGDRKEGDDVVFIHGVDEQRRELHVLRKKGDEFGLGVVRPVEEGRPVSGDIVRLKPRPKLPMICDVEEILPLPAPPGPGGRLHAGPPRVSTEAYRRGWELVFGGPKAPDPAEVN